VSSTKAGKRSSVLAEEITIVKQETKQKKKKKWAEKETKTIRVVYNQEKKPLFHAQKGGEKNQ